MKYIGEEYEINVDTCDSEVKDKLTDILMENGRAFTDSSGRLGYCDWVKQEIHVKPGVRPFIRQPYRLDPTTKAELQKQIDKLLANGVIKEEYSQWASPVIAIKKQPPKARRHTRQTDTRPEVRVCVDYRFLNSHAIPKQCHIPQTRDLLDDIARSKAKIFSSLDLKSGFHQMGLTDDSKQYTAFLYNRKQYVYNVSPQGCNSSPYFFQRLMYKVLEEVNDPEHCFCYIDDVLLASPTIEHHYQLLDKVLKAFIKANLTLCGKKCDFMKHKATFLGHEINEHGITIPQKHCHAMATWPIPKNVRDVRSFVGCANYFRSWLPGRGKLLKPLTHLTKKHVKFQWREDQQQAFEMIRKQLSSQPVLRHPDFQKEFMVYTDASSEAFGASLCQKDKDGELYPVAFMGKSTNPTQAKWSTTDLEAYAITMAVAEWEAYLTHRKFTVATDHKALTYIFKGTSRLTPKLARYAMFLSQFTYDIIHVPGTANTIADALSRRMYDTQKHETNDILSDYPADQSKQEINPASITAITRSQTRKQTSETAGCNHEDNDCPDETRHTPQDDVMTDSAQQASDPHKVTVGEHEEHDANKSPVGLQKGTDEADIDLTVEALRKGQRLDEFCNDIIQLLENDTLPTDPTRRQRTQKREMDFCMRDQILYQIWTPVIGRGVKFRALIPKSLQYSYIHEAHHSEMASHLGTDRMMASLRERVIFKSMYESVRKYVSNCTVCRLVKPSNHKITRPPGIYDPAYRIFSRIHTDIAGPFPGTQNGNRYFALAVCATSGYIIGWCMRSIHADQFARKFFDHVTCKIGPPEQLVSDNGSNYRAKLWTKAADMMGVRLTFVSPYSPAGNGIAERSIGKVSEALRLTARSNPHQWDQKLQSCIYSLNNTLHSSHGLTPQEIVFGTSGRQPIDKIIQPTDDDMFPLFQIIRDLEQCRADSLATAVELRRLRDAETRKKQPQAHTSDKLVEGMVVFWSKPNTKPEQDLGKMGCRNFGPYMVAKRHMYTAVLKHLHTGVTHKIPVNISQLSIAKDYERDYHTRQDKTVLYRQ
jgi:hypothetical protein